MQRESLAAEVLGITHQYRPEQTFMQGYQTLTGRPLNEAESEWILSQTPGSRTAKELATDIKVLDEIAYGQANSDANTLVEWPVYEDLMRRHGTRATWTASALMIGSLTPMSSRAFVCAARSLYGAKRAYIVDPQATPEKTRHGNFIYGDGLQLPIKDGTMDYVHTNRLLHMLSGAKSADELDEGNAERLFTEISRVMPPGGQLLMAERAPGVTQDTNPLEDTQALRKTIEFVSKLLPALNFGYIVIESVSHYDPRRFLFDHKRKFNRSYLGESASEFSLFAQKPV